MKFGLLDVDSSTAAVSAIGGQAQTSVNEKNLSHAFINYLNEHGGIAGRKLEVVEYTQNPSSNNYQTDLSAACAKFTQDNKLSVVLQAQLGAVVSENYENCLTKAGVTSIAMSYATGDNSLYRRHPRLFNVSAPSVDRRMQAVFDGLYNSGYYTSKNTIGLLVEDCPESQAAYRNTVVPLAQSLNLKLVVRTVSCLRGFSDVGALSAQVQSAVLPFRSAGVDRVSFISGFEILMLLFFETNAANQGYKPSYGLSSNSPVGSSSGQFSDDAQSRMRGMGWSPNTDVRGPLTTPAAKKCDAMARSQGIVPQTQGDVALLRAVCDLFLVFKTSVEAVGGRSDSASVLNGLLTASRSYDSATLLGHRLRLGAGRQDGAAQVAEWGFVSSCKCMKYLGGPRALS